MAPAPPTNPVHRTSLRWVLWVAVGSAVGGAACQRDPASTAPVEGFVQSSGSMRPTLEEGDWILVERGARPRVGDVVVYRVKSSAAAPGDAPLLKRIVAGPGDRVAVRDGVAVVNGVALGAGPCSPGEPPITAKGASVEVDCAVERSPGGREYRVITQRYIVGNDCDEVRVPPEHYFVLGDFRDHSADSRHHGPVPASQILGVATRIYMSSTPSRIGRKL